MSIPFSTRFVQNFTIRLIGVKSRSILVLESADENYSMHLDMKIHLTIISSNDTFCGLL